MKRLEDIGFYMGMSKSKALKLDKYYKGDRDKHLIFIIPIFGGYRCHPIERSTYETFLDNIKDEKILLEGFKVMFDAYYLSGTNHAISNNSLFMEYVEYNSKTPTSLKLLIYENQCRIVPLDLHCIKKGLYLNIN